MEGAGVEPKRPRCRRLPRDKRCAIPQPRERASGRIAGALSQWTICDRTARQREDSRLRPGNADVCCQLLRVPGPRPQQAHAERRLTRLLCTNAVVCGEVREAPAGHDAREPVQPARTRLRRHGKAGVCARSIGAHGVVPRWAQVGAPAIAWELDKLGAVGAAAAHDRADPRSRGRDASASGRGGGCRRGSPYPAPVAERRRRCGSGRSRRSAPP